MLMPPVTQAEVQQDETSFRVRAKHVYYTVTKPFKHINEFVTQSVNRHWQDISIRLQLFELIIDR